MNLTPANDAIKKGDFPMSMHTAYKWNSEKKYPSLIIKVAGKLFVDLDEWNHMAEQARENQIEEAKRINAGLNVAEN